MQEPCHPRPSTFSHKTKTPAHKEPRPCPSETKKLSLSLIHTALCLPTRDPAGLTRPALSFFLLMGEKLCTVPCMHSPVSCPQALEEGFSWSWWLRLGRDSFVGDVVVFNSTVAARGSECLALCGARLSVGEGERDLSIQMETPALAHQRDVQKIRSGVLYNVV